MLCPICKDYELNLCEEDTDIDGEYKTIFACNNADCIVSFIYIFSDSPIKEGEEDDEG